jgi:hypothetical protein
MPPGMGTAVESGSPRLTRFSIAHIAKHDLIVAEELCERELESPRLTSRHRTSVYGSSRRDPEGSQNPHAR